MVLRTAFAASLIGLAAILPLGCRRIDPDAEQADPAIQRITFAGFSVAREAYGRALLPDFDQKWESDHKRRLDIRQAYESSGVQTRSILGGLDVDVAALTIAPEVERLVEAGLVSKDWQDRPDQGVPAFSTVVFAVRPGNPKNIRSWEDLSRSDVRVLMPSPDTSGAAQWNVAAIYGALKRQGMSDEDVFQRLRQVRQRVRVYGKSGRESMQQFVHGVGDVLVAWENEALLRQSKGDEIEVVWPESTIRMEPPVVAVGNPADAAEDLIRYLSTPRAQRLYAENFFRPRHPQVLEEYRETFPAIPDLFTIEHLGGWDEVRETLFSEEGLWPRAAR